MLIIHRDESTKSEPTLVDMPVWLVHMNLSGLIFSPAFAIAQLLYDTYLSLRLTIFDTEWGGADPP